MSFYTLIQGDSREVITTLEENSVDMIITDPPYGFNRFETDDENCVDLTVDVLEKSKRVLKQGGFVFVFGPTNKTLIQMVNSIPLTFHRLFRPIQVVFLKCLSIRKGLLIDHTILRLSFQRTQSAYNYQIVSHWPEFLDQYNKENASKVLPE